MGSIPGLGRYSVGGHGNPLQYSCLENPIDREVWQAMVHCYCSVDQSCQFFVTPQTAACQSSLSFTVSQHLLKLIPIEKVVPSNHFILCWPLVLLPPIFPSNRVLSNESSPHIRWPKYWSFRFSISPSNEYSGLISFRMDQFDLLAVQGVFKSLLQHHSSKA